MKKTKSIKASILSRINQLDWKSETYKRNAITLCEEIYSLYGGRPYDRPIEVSSKWMRSKVNDKILTSILNTLINGDVLIRNNYFSKEKSIAKSYMFNQDLIFEDINFNLININNKSKLISSCGEFLENNNKYNQNLNHNLYLINIYNNFRFISSCGEFLENNNNSLYNYIETNLLSLTIDKRYENYINTYSIKKSDLILNEDIEDKMVNITYNTVDSKEYTYTRDNAINTAKETNCDLIKYKNDFYIDTVEDFLLKKSHIHKLYLSQSIFNLENNIYNINRNMTNNRLDYNLTNMKGDLFQFLKLDNEELIELDIANAQFAILANIGLDLDDNFVKLSIDGDLYEYVANELNINRQEAKDKMFRVAFGKISKSQDDIRKIFPKTMLFVDEYKRQNGYQYFSNLLQKTESYIMIDQILNYLISKGYKVFPIHDAFRVKKSQANEIEKLINELFKQLKFNCNIRMKNKQ